MYINMDIPMENTELNIDYRYQYTYRYLLAPDGSVSEGVPQVQQVVVPTGEELVLVGMDGDPPQLIHVTLDNSTELQVE